MSQESIKWLNLNTLIGFTEKRGRAWHYRAEEQDGESNHYPGAIPVEDVKRRLFHWEAEPVPIFVPSLTNPLEYVQVPDQVAWRRNDDGQVLGIHTEDYKGHQFTKWLVDNVANILDDGLAIGSAGLLRGGRQAWVSVEVPGTITTPEGVEHRPNLLATTSFDGSLATQYKRVVQIVRCDNTMHAGLGEKGQEIKIRHTGDSELKIANAREALAIVHTIADEFGAEVARLCAIEVSDAQWNRFLDSHLELKADASKRSVTIASKKRDTLVRLYETDIRVQPWAGSAFGVLQAVNTYRHHEGTVRGMPRPERNMANAIEGITAELDGLALEKLMAVLA